MSPSYLGTRVDTRYLYLLIRFKSLLLFNNFINTRFSCRKRMQRYNHFPNYQNIFSKKIQDTSEHVDYQHMKRRKKICDGWKINRKNLLKNPPQLRKSTLRRIKIRKLHIYQNISLNISTITKQRTLGTAFAPTACLPLTKALPTPTAVGVGRALVGGWLGYGGKRGSVGGRKKTKWRAEEIFLRTNILINN